MKSVKKLEANIEIYFKSLEDRMNEDKYSQVIKTSIGEDKVLIIDIYDNILCNIDYQAIQDKYEDIHDKYKYVGTIYNLLIERIIGYIEVGNWYYVYTFLYFIYRLYKDIKIDISLSKLEFLNSNVLEINKDTCNNENVTNREEMISNMKMKTCCDFTYKNLSFVIFNNLKMKRWFIVIDDLKNIEILRDIELELCNIEKELG